VGDEETTRERTGTTNKHEWTRIEEQGSVLISVHPRELAVFKMTGTAIDANERE
jgi:hypothetical protein